MNYRSTLFFIFVSLITVLFFSYDSKNYGLEDLIGTWKGENNGVAVRIIFTENKKFDLCFLDYNMTKCDKITGEYDINFSKSPIPLSIKKIKEINDNLFTIVRFENEKTIVISKFSTRWRLQPVSFIPENYITLNRVNMNITN